MLEDTNEDGAHQGFIDVSLDLRVYDNGGNQDLVPDEMVVTQHTVSIAGSSTSGNLTAGELEADVDDALASVFGEGNMSAQVDAEGRLSLVTDPLVSNIGYFQLLYSSENEVALGFSPMPNEAIVANRK